MSRPNLSRRLVLEAPTRVPDGAGGAATVWAPIGALWADLSAQGPREERGPAGPTESRPFRVIVRGSPLGAPSRPEAGQRLREGARLFLIDSVAEADAFGRFLMCQAHEEAVG